MPRTVSAVGLNFDMIGSPNFVRFVNGRSDYGPIIDVGIPLAD